jgi:beta-ribofuranosylaminobenzene 5'-phosphate synthase
MEEVKLRTPSRIHITLIDLNASLGRMDGGIGIALEEPFIEISGIKSERLLVNGKNRERAKDAASRMLRALSVEGGVELTVEETYEPHIGLGSGTQLMLGVGYAISKIYNIDITLRKISEIMKRGGTSGIGTAAFEHGGFILDGGHSTTEKRAFLPSSASKASPAPILARYDFPDWKIASVIPKGLEVQGESEVNIFQKHCPIPISDVRRLCHLVLMRLLPAIVEDDITAFGEGINEIQKTGFKKIEVELQNPMVKDILKRCQKYTFGAGLSSFGPTIYCLLDDVDMLLEQVGDDARVIVTKANNEGVRLSK